MGLQQTMMLAQHHNAEEPFKTFLFGLKGNSILLTKDLKLYTLLLTLLV